MISPSAAALPALARLSAALAFALPATALAQEISVELKPVVVTGSRAEADSFELPWSIDSVNANNARAGNLGVNASEALGGLPGLVIQNRQNYAQDLQISIRGFGARSAFGVRGVKLIADGIPATNPDGQGQAATFNLDTAERFEVLRGPFSTVYGNHAGGVVQLFSRDGKGAPRISAGVSGGAWGTTRLGIGAEGEARGVGFVLDASRFDTDGYRDHSKARRDQGFAKITVRPDEDSKLSLVGSSLKQKDTQDPLGLTWGRWQRDPRGVENVALQYDTRKSIDHLQGGLNYERRFGRDLLQLVAYSGTRRVTQYQAIPIAAQANPRHAGGVVDFERDFHGVGARWIAQRDLAGGELTLTTGVDYDRSEDDRRGYENFRGSTLGVKGALRRDETDTVTSIDPYVQASWKHGAWLWSAGVRHSRVEFEVDDHYVRGANGDDSGKLRFSKTTPAFGFSYALNPLLNLYASLGKGFETPTLNELSYASPNSGFNFGLKPSTSTQAEAGLKAIVGEATRVNLALFRIRTWDEIVVAESFGGRTSYANAGRTLREGIELGVESELARQWTARAALTWLDARYDRAFNSRGAVVPSGKRIPGIPEFAFYGELAWTPQAGLTLAAEALHRSKVQVNDLNDARAAPAYTLVNLRLNAEQRSGPWTFSQLLRVDNVFDREHIGSIIAGDAQGRYYEPGTERSVYAGVRASYAF